MNQPQATVLLVEELSVVGSHWACAGGRKSNAVHWSRCSRSLPLLRSLERRKGWGLGAPRLVVHGSKGKVCRQKGFLPRIAADGETETAGATRAARALHMSHVITAKCDPAGRWSGCFGGFRREAPRAGPEGLMGNRIFFVRGPPNRHPRQCSGKKR